MTFEEVLDQAIAMLQRRGRVTYRTLQRQFQLDDAALDDLKDALLYAHPQIRDDAGRGLVWTGDPSPAPGAAATPTATPERPPLASTQVASVSRAAASFGDRRTQSSATCRIVTRFRSTAACTSARLGEKGFRLNSPVGTGMNAIVSLSRKGNAPKETESFPSLASTPACEARQRARPARRRAGGTP